MVKENKRLIRWRHGTLSLIAAVLSLFVIVGCSDDNDSIIENDDDENSAIILNELRTAALIDALCELDTLPNGDVTLRSRLGVVLEETTPTVYYACADSASEAEDAYRGIVSVFQESEDSPVPNNEVQYDDNRITFNEGNKARGEIARINIDVPELKDVLTDIVFISRERWPLNDTASPFNFLSLWKENSTGYYYLCVRKAEGDRGIMITFDGGWGKEWFTKYDHWQGKFYLWSGTASWEAFECLCRSMKNNSTRYSNMLNALKKDKNRNGKGEMFFTLFQSLSKGHSVTFDRNYTYKHGLWWAYNCYYVTLYKTTIYHDHSWGHWSAYYKHKKTPQRNEASHSFYFDAGFDKSGWTCIFK